MSGPTQVHASSASSSLTTTKRKRTHSDASEHRPVKKAHLDDDAPGAAGSTQESCLHDEEPGRPAEVLDIHTCNICLNDLMDETLFRLKQCAHAFCRPCIARWIKTQGSVTNLIQDVLPSCPMCRNILPPDEVQELARVIRSDGQKDLNKCHVRGCRAKVVNLERHRQRMHVPTPCELCDVEVERFSLKEHRQTSCNVVTDKCPLPGCPVQVPRQSANEFLQRYWNSDETLGRDLINHHHCVGVSMCALCDTYQYFLTNEEFHAHFNESHS